MRIIVREYVLEGLARVSPFPSRLFVDQTAERGTIRLSSLSPLYPAQFFCPFYFHFAHFPQKWINARKNASAPRTGGSLFSGIVEFRALNLGRPCAHCDLSFCFSMFSLLSLVCPSVIPCHTYCHRPFPVYPSPLLPLLSQPLGRAKALFFVSHGFHGGLGQLFAHSENNKHVKRRTGRRIR